MLRCIPGPHLHLAESRVFSACLSAFLGQCSWVQPSQLGQSGAHFKEYHVPFSVQLQALNVKSLVPGTEMALCCLGARTGEGR